MNYTWEELKKPNQNIVQTLSEELGTPEILSTLLAQRGIEDFDEAKHFFRPQLKDLHDPFLMQDMEEAIICLNEVLSKEGKIMVYGDYDVDGSTSVSLVYSFLKEHHENLMFYIPDRYKEGYGISLKGIDVAEEEGVELIIALDCGIKAIEQIEYANSKNIQFIICDHHTPGDELPDAIAVLDPKRKDCNYPYKELSGCGVGFKLLQAYCMANDIDQKEVLKYLDYVVISIASDIVQITGENRTLAYYGLKKINSNPLFGVKQMMELTGYKGNFTIADVVFKIGPRINAAGRMHSATSAVKLLITQNQAEANEIGEAISNYNQDRKDVDENITYEALDQIKNKGWENRNSFVLYQPNWHKGVIGIVASRVIESYYRPTIILTKSGDKVAGSARSVEGFSVYDAISACSEHLIQFGGHTMAAGLTMKEEKVEGFRAAFEKYVTENLSEELKVPRLQVVSRLDLLDLKDKAAALENKYPKFYRLLQQMAPFGPGNAIPLFQLDNIKCKSTKVLGGKHLKLTAHVEEDESFVVSGIGFGLGHLQQVVHQNSKISVTAYVESNDWNGLHQIQLRIIDIKPNQA